MSAKPRPKAFQPFGGVPYCPHCKARIAKQGKKFCSPCFKEINKQINQMWYQFTHHWETPKQ